MAEEEAANQYGEELMSEEVRTLELRLRDAIDRVRLLTSEIDEWSRVTGCNRPHQVENKYREYEKAIEQSREMAKTAELRMKLSEAEWKKVSDCDSPAHLAQVLEAIKADIAKQCAELKEMRRGIDQNNQVGSGEALVPGDTKTEQA